MIALFSKSKFEGTTDDVIDWLLLFKGNLKRINGSDYFKESGFGAQNNTFHDRLNDVKSCWFRRWIDSFADLMQERSLREGDAFDEETTACIKYLVENDLGHFVTDPDQFPELSREYTNPGTSSHAIIELSDTTVLMSLKHCNHSAMLE